MGTRDCPIGQGGIRYPMPAAGPECFLLPMRLVPKRFSKAMRRWRTRPLRICLIAGAGLLLLSSCRGLLATVSRTPADHGGAAVGVHTSSSAERDIAKRAMGNHESAGISRAHRWTNDPDRPGFYRGANAGRGIAEPDAGRSGAEPNAVRHGHAKARGLPDCHCGAGRHLASSDRVCAGGDWREPRLRRAQRRECAVLGRQ